MMKANAPIDGGPRRSRLSAFFGGLICLSLSITGFYIAFGGFPVEGGIPFLPGSGYQLLGRVLIGAGALTVYAFYEFLMLRRIG